MFYKTHLTYIFFPKIFKMFLKLLFYNFSRLFQNFLKIISCFSDNFSQVFPKIDAEMSRKFFLECLKICTKYSLLLFKIFRYIIDILKISENGLIFLTPLSYGGNLQYIHFSHRMTIQIKSKKYTDFRHIPKVSDQK